MTFYDLMKYAKTGIASADMSMYDKQKALAMFGGGGGSWPDSELYGVPPMAFQSDGRPISEYMIIGNMVQNGTPTPSAPVYPSECGDLVLSGEHAGKYVVPVSVGGQTISFYLDEPIRAIGNTNDGIISFSSVGMNGAGRAIQKIVLTGEEDYLRYNATYPRCYLEIPGAVYTDGRITVMCSHYQAKNNGGLSVVTSYPSGSISWRTALNQLTIIDSNLQSLDDFKAFLAQENANNTPVTIWYCLADNAILPMEMPNLKPTKGVNTLTVDTTLQPQGVMLYGGIKSN